jgi:hypothetical protein
MLRVDATKSRNQAKKELDEVGEMFLDSWLMFYLISNTTSSSFL